MQWEYKAIAIVFSGTTELETELNGMGKDGWELVHFDGEDEPEEDGLFYANCVFKRPALHAQTVEFGSVTVEGESGERHESLVALLQSIATQKRERASEEARLRARSHNQRGGRL